MQINKSAKLKNVGYYAFTEQFHVSPGSAETLVRRGGITNYRSIVCSLSNISVKKITKIG